MLRYFTVSVGAVIICGASVAATKPAAEDSVARRKEAMHAMFGALQTLVPLSLDGEAFQRAENRGVVSKSLATIAQEADQLDGHANRDDAAFKYLSHSLAGSAREAKRWYERGEPDEARFIIHNLVENCLACHNKKSASHEFPGAEQFFKKLETAKLGREELALYQIATRQFDKALETYEAALRDRSGGRHLSMASFDQYLTIALRVKKDWQRPERFLSQLRREAKLATFEERYLDLWIRDLKVLGKDKLLDQPSITRARELIGRGQKEQDFPEDKSGEVYFIAASAQLQEIVASPQTSLDEKAEAYYWLGMTETVIGREYWLSQIEVYLETAIRLRPKGPFAKKAYALLEEQTYIEYSGSRGSDIPDEVQDELLELRSLTDPVR